MSRARRARIGNGNGGNGRPPIITDVIPDSAGPGAEVVLSGSRFGLQSDLTTVTFDPSARELGPVDAEIVSWAATSVHVRVPTLAQLGAAGGATIRLTNDVGSDTVTFTVLDTQPPQIDSLTPDRGLPGTMLRITGRRFGLPGTRGTRVSFGGQFVPAFSWGLNEVQVTVPDPPLGSPGPKDVRVVTPWGASLPASFTMLEPPTITSVTPPEGAPDVAIVIAGRAFDEFVAGVSQVELVFTDSDLGSVVVTPIEVASWTPTQILAFVPGLSALKESGDKQLVVRTPVAASAPASFSVIDVGSITAWTRIEPHARSDDLDAGLEIGLRAELADPLWLLGRQWVLGELQGEDAGSPVIAAVEGEAAPLDRWRPGEGPDRDLPQDVPLETLVEREPVVVASEGAFEDRRLAAEAGLHFIRMLTAHEIPPGQVKKYRARYVELYGIDPPSIPDPRLDPASLRFLAVVAGRVPDGAKLFTALRQALPPERGGEGRLPDDPAIRSRDEEAVRGAIADWFTWCESFASETEAGETAWERERLEYAFAVAAQTSVGEIVLEAPEYSEGRLDWYAFRRASDSLGRSDGEERSPKPISTTVIPVPVVYPGMPAARFFELEDARTNFGLVDAGPADLARLLFVEFATVFGNDWFAIPLGDVSVGAVIRVDSLVVTDTFGETTSVAPFRETQAGGAFRLFQPTDPIDDRRDLLVLPATIASSLESAPLEDVVFTRDELANMGWAVERTVASVSGRPMSREETGRDTQDRAEAIAPAEAGGPPLTYTLMTPVADFFIPLVPQLDGESRRLARAAMLRPGPGGTLEPIPALGRILEPEEPSLLIFDNEVPPEGGRVTRTWQLARDSRGRTHLWIGRQKKATKPTPSSGLRFDVVEPTRAERS